LVFSDFLAIFGCKRVNCDEMDRDRPRLLANRNCYRLSRVSRALARISCFIRLGQYTPSVLVTLTIIFYARKQLLLLTRFSHRNSVRPSVRLSHGWIRQKRSKLGSPNLHRRLPGKL